MKVAFDVQKAAAAAVLKTVAATAVQNWDSTGMQGCRDPSRDPSRDMECRDGTQGPDYQGHSRDSHSDGGPGPGGGHKKKTSFTKPPQQSNYQAPEPRPADSLISFGLPVTGGYQSGSSRERSLASPPELRLRRAPGIWNLEFY